MKPSTPTRELLFACAVWDASKAELARVREAARAEIDWDLWLGLIQRHRIVPHALRALASAEAAIPRTVSTELKNETLAIATRALGRARQLSELVATLARAGVRSLPFKGPMLSLAAYGDIGIRDSVDLDIVVCPADVDRARDAMIGGGYVSRLQMSPAQERMLQRSFGHFKYGLGKSAEQSGTESAPVELHWRFAAPRYPWSLPPEEVLARAGGSEVAGVNIAVPDATDQLLLQAMHGARHQWERLEWLVAFHELLRRPGVDEAQLLERARHHGSSRAIRVALRVTRDLWDTPMSPRLSAAGDDAQIALLAREIERALETGGATEITDEPYAFNGQLMDDAGDRRRYLSHSVFAPTVREWELVRLPDALLPLYYPIRFVRVLARRIGSLFAIKR